MTPTRRDAGDGAAGVADTGDSAASDGAASDGVAADGAAGDSAAGDGVARDGAAGGSAAGGSAGLRVARFGGPGSEQTVPENAVADFGGSYGSDRGRDPDDTVSHVLLGPLGEPDSKPVAAFGEQIEGGDRAVESAPVAGFTGGTAARRSSAAVPSAPRSAVLRPAASGPAAPRSAVSEPVVSRSVVAESGVAQPPADEEPAADEDRRARSGRSTRAGTRSGGSFGGPSRRGAGRGGFGSAPAELDPDADPIAVAREVCLRLLADRARTRQELADALRRRGVPDDAAHSVLDRFDEVGLIDDTAFAGQWVRSRHNNKGLARRAIAMELRRKGVDDEVAGDALAEVDAGAEERRARELVDHKLRTVPADTPEQQKKAAGRLVGMLARKGYGGGVAYRVVREALAAHGAELDELGSEPPD